MKTKIAIILAAASLATARAEYLNLTPSSGGKRTVLGDPVDWTGKLWSDGGIILFGNAANKVPIADSGGKLVLSLIPSLPASQTTSGTFDKDRIPATLNATTFLGAGVSSPFFNNVAITAPGSPATLTLTGGKTFSVANSVAISGTDGKGLTLTGSLTVGADTTIGGGGTLALGGFTVTAPATGTMVLTTRTVTEGAGLAGNTYDLSANRTLALGTPSTLTVSTTNSASGTTHVHAVTSSSNPGAAASLLSTNSGGQLTLVDLLANATTFNLVNATATTVNFAGAATSLTVGATTGTLTLRNASVQHSGTLVGPVTGYNTDLGQLSKKYKAVFASELWVETLVAQNTIATVGGRILVGPTTALIADLSAGATTVDVKHNQMSSGDRVYLEANGAVEFLAVTSAATPITGGYRYSVTRDLDGTGANAWSAGDAVFNTGATGNGFIDIYSVQAVKGGTQLGPAIVGNIRNSATYNDWSEHWAVGNLYGLYGYGAAATYGAGFGKYEAGKTNITIDSTNGFRIRSFNTVLGQWDQSGNILVGQTGAGQSNVYITAGAVKLRNNATDVLRLDTTNGLQMLNSSGVSLIQLDTSGNARLGAVATNKANVYYNASNGRLEFRGSTNGTVVQSYIDTDGSFVAGTAILNSSGLVISNDSAIAFKNPSGAVTGLVTAFGNALDLQSSNPAPLNVSAITGASISATNDVNNGAFVSAQARGSGQALYPNSQYVMIYGVGGTFKGLSVAASAQIPTHMLDVYGDVWSQGGLALRDTSAAFDVTIGATSSTALTANRAYTIDVTNASRTIKLTGNPTLADWFDQSVKASASPTFAALTVGSGSPTVGRAVVVFGSNAGIAIKNTDSGGHQYSLINYTANTGDFAIRDDTAGAYRLYIDASGNVGVGIAPSGVAFQAHGTIRAATANDQGVLSLGEEAGSTSVNVGVWRGASNSLSGGNYLNLGGYNGIQFSVGAANIGSQTSVMLLGSTTLTLSTKMEIGLATGTASQTGDIAVARSGGTTGVIYLNSSGGRYLYYDGTAYNLPGGSLIVNGTTYTSSRSLKQNIVDWDADARTTRRRLRARSFERKDAPGKKEVGFVAEEVAEVLPEAVRWTGLDANNPTKPRVMGYDPMAIVTKHEAELQEQDDRIEELEAEVAQLLGKPRPPARADAAPAPQPTPPPSGSPLPKPTPVATPPPSASPARPATPPPVSPTPRRKK